MSQLSWHKRWYKKIHMKLYGENHALPSNTCSYIMNWVFIIISPFVLLYMIGVAIAAMVYLCYEAFWGSSTEVFFPLSIFICIILIVITGIVVPDMDWWKKLKQKICKPIKW